MLLVNLSPLTFIHLLAIFLVFLGGLITFSSSLLIKKIGLQRLVKDKEAYQSFVLAQSKLQEVDDETKFRDLLLEKFRNGEFKNNRYAQSFYEESVLRVKLTGLAIALPGMLWILFMF